MEPQSFLSLLYRWEIVRTNKVEQFAEASETTAEFMELIGQYIITEYHEEGATARRGNLAAWLPWAYATQHQATLIEEMQDAARFADLEGSHTDEAVYVELKKRHDAIRLAAFLPDGALHNRQGDDMPVLYMDDQEVE